MPKTGCQVVVYHSRTLHKRIANRAANKLEAGFFQGLAHGIGLRGRCRHKAAFVPLVRERAAINELPDELVKRAAIGR